jgi:hypothetical protein
VSSTRQQEAFWGVNERIANMEGEENKKSPEKLDKGLWNNIISLGKRAI